ncbi:MAG: tetratricopeptide repeat protein [Pseudomonadales bacterium]
MKRSATVGSGALGMVLTLSGALALLPAQGVAAETILFNESSAYQCYRAALQGGDGDDIEVCTIAIEHQPLVSRDLAATYSNRGLLLARAGEIEAALKDHEKAIMLQPDIGSLYINRSNTYVRARRLNDAMQDLERAIAIGDDSVAAAYYNRALLFQQLGDGRAARLDAERAAELAPETEAYRAFAAELARADAASD